MVGAWNSMNRINRTIKKVKQVELSNLYINNPLPIENHQILRWLSKAILWAKSNSYWKEIINYPGSTYWSYQLPKSIRKLAATTPCLLQPITVAFGYIGCQHSPVKLPSTAKKNQETSCDNTLSSAADNRCLWMLNSYLHINNSGQPCLPVHKMHSEALQALPLQVIDIGLLHWNTKKISGILPNICGLSLGQLACV